FDHHFHLESAPLEECLNCRKCGRFSRFRSPGKLNDHGLSTFLLKVFSQRLSANLKVSLHALSRPRARFENCFRSRVDGSSSLFGMAGFIARIVDMMLLLLNFLPGNPEVFTRFPELPIR